MDIIRSARLVCILTLLCAPSVQAKEKKKNARAGSIYFSWGYNREWYTRSTVGVKQAALGNDYQLVSVAGHDKSDWSDFFHRELTIPQYNYRIGYFFNQKQDLGIEINFDHTKYIITEDQDIQLKGTMGGQATTEMIHFSKPNGFYYYLNNGANFLVFNIVKRKQVYHTKNNMLKVDLLGKAGIGPVIPHVENSFFSQPNTPHFQIGGWNGALETAARVTVARYAYLEFAQKVVYARYSGLQIYEGTARQSFGCYELVLSLGLTFPTTRHNPLFVH